MSDVVVDAFKWAFSFDPRTRAYTGPVQAWLSPMDGRYPLPANAVAFAPGENPGPHKIHRLSDDGRAWEVVDDFRGVPLWRKSNGWPVANGLRIGDPLPGDVTTIAPPAFKASERKCAAFDDAIGEWVERPDYSGVQLWDKATAAPVPPLAPGQPLPDELTDLAPPRGDRIVAQWDGEQGRWAEVADWRGVVFWLPDGTQGVIEALGDVPPEGFLLSPPPRPRAVDVAPEGALVRDALLGEASSRIGPLQDAVELGIATDDESALLLAWKRYRVELSRLDPAAPGVAWPKKPG